MKVVVFRNEGNFNLIKDSEWELFSNRIRKIFGNVLNEKITYSRISVDDSGEKVNMLFYIKQYESLQTLTLKFENFLCKQITYDNDGKKKEYQTKNIELLWHKFLVECLGDGVLHDIYDFYKKNNRDFEELKDFVRRTEGL